MIRSRWTLVTICLALGVVGADAAPAWAQFGVVLSGGGPVNRSFAGATTAAPLDALGALFWNPATLSALPQSEVNVGAEMLFGHPNVRSEVSANAFGPGFPAAPLSGSTSSDNAGVLIPNVGLVQHLDDSTWTFGLGLLTAGGFSTNYPASLTNPVLTPQAPGGVGFGNVAAELQVLQVVPALSMQVTEHLAVGAVPVLDLVRLNINPLIVVPPDDADRNGFPTYPEGFHTPYHVGAGFEAGVFYVTDAGWNFGASFKSPQWFERFRYNTTDELGRPRGDSLRFEFPLIASLGVSYSGLDRWLFAGDVRYIDYRNAAAFNGGGFTPQGAVQGVGWDSIFVLAVGAQYQMTDQLSLRLGYAYNTNPQNGDVAIFNVGAPTIIQHTGSAGLTWRLSEHLLVSAAYVRGFENSIEGPFRVPQGPVPGTSVRNTVSADGLSLGMTVRY